MTDALTEDDRAAMHARYRAEREKRLRDDGNEQYVEVTGVFERYAEDPYTERVEREPVTNEVTFAFVGGGFAGLCTAAALVKAGVEDVRVIEKGGDFGGTWYWNRYPGAQCDTAAMIYMPLLEDTGHVPSEKYTHAPEILSHCQGIGRHFGLYDNAVFSTEVTQIVWNEEASRWIIRTDRGDEMRAKYVAVGTGPLHGPKLPGIPGIESFAGHTFHTTRWDYDYTGGNPAGAPMTELADKRVGIIGTGATAVQCVPHLARSCGELYVFQRTPSSIDVRNNRDIDPDWFATLEPGWQAAWRDNFTTLQTGGFADEDLVMDGWTDISQRIRDRVLANGDDFSPAAMLKAFHDSDDEKMEEIRARVEQLIEDPGTADALKPWYRQLCKRPCFHDEYLQSYNAPGAHLIDTDGQGVEAITECGVVVNGTEYEVDCIIYASGFEVGTEQTRRSGFDVEGREGTTLFTEYWSEGMRTLHGLHSYGFPNFFVVGLSQAANLISNVPHNLVEAGETIAAVVGHAEGIGADQVEVTLDAEQAWVDHLVAGMRMFGGGAACTPGYYNNEGKPDEGQVLNRLGYPEGPLAYFAHIQQWRESGNFEGLEFRDDAGAVL
ncbi:MAG: NAD(P)/FAD-dependent oxidoreductase [Acidimicrobiales bacterium]|nr:NAD(P)/FAD-dependent oxidoreductase [Acidimicrobiales bacterium]